MPTSNQQDASRPVINVTRERVRRPSLAPDVELVGRIQDTAFDDEQWLICFDESTYIQSTPLLYHVLLYSDGNRTTEEIARQVMAATGIEVTGEDVDWLVMNRLIPSGLLDLGVDEEEMGEGPRPAELPVLGLRWRIPLFPYEWTVPFANLFKHLYWPPLMLAVLVAAVAINVWVFVDATVIASAHALMFQPEFILLIFGLDLASTLFHELGHAAALRRAGARYGWIGAALYIIFPVFYTDVTHVYRLNRWERIRVDLGGMYFELIMTVAFFGLYHATGNGIFLIAIVLTTMSFLQQFTPFLRFDGYYTIADIMGVNEPLSIVKPFLRDQIPWPRNRTKSLPNMRTGPRIAFTIYLLAIVAFLSYPLFIGAFAGRQFAGTLTESGRHLWNQFVVALNQGDVLFTVVSALQLFFWSLIPLGVMLFTLTLIRHFSYGGFALWGLIAPRLPRSEGFRIGVRTILATILFGFGFVLIGNASVLSPSVSQTWDTPEQATSSASGNEVAAVSEAASRSTTQAANLAVSSDAPFWGLSVESDAPELTSIAPQNVSAGPVSRDSGIAPPWHTGRHQDASLSGGPENLAAEPVQSPQPDVVMHVVEPGESLWVIAERFGTSVEALAAHNNIENPSVIFAGDVLEIPR